MPAFYYADLTGCAIIESVRTDKCLYWEGKKRMAVSFRALNDMFFKQYPEFDRSVRLPEEPDGEVKGIRMLLPDEQLQEGFCYIGASKLVHSRAEEGKAVWMIGVSDQTEDKDGADGNTLITSKDVGYVLNAFWSSFERVSDWDREMDLELADGCSVQQILNMSLGLIDMPIHVYDPSMKLLGYINEQDKDNLYFQNIIQKGYLVQDLFSAISNGHVFEELEKDSETFITTYQPSGAYVSIKLIRNSQVPLAYVFVIHGWPTQIDAYRGLLSLLSEKIQYALEKTEPLAQRQNYLYEYFVTDIMNGELDTPDDIAIRFHYIDISEAKHYVLLRLCFKEDTMIPLGYLSSAMKSVFSESYFFHYEEQPYVMLHLQNEDGIREREDVLQVMDSLLKQFDCIAVASGSFENLVLLSNVRSQIDMVSELFRKGMIRPLSGNVIRIENCRTEQMMMMCLNMAPADVWINPAIREIMEDDENRSMKYIDFLNTYREENCEVVRTAERLFMHRSNVTYHLRKIRERYGLDAADSEQCFDMVWSLRLLEFEEKLHKR